MTYVLQKAQILAREDEIAINAKSKEKVHGPPHKKQWNKSFQGKNDYRNRGQKRHRNDDVEKKELPLYDTCDKKQGGICFRKVGVCFKCRKPGHFIQNCPELKKDPGAHRKDQKTQGRVYAFTRQEAEASPSVVSGIVPISGHLAFVLFDSGSTHSFVSHTFARKMDCVPDMLKTELCVDTPSGESLCAKKFLKSCRI
ncbi:hypothetical protein LWI28_001661 [Acer negundo]|uniref:CCHC-type domain-containing protein n=1 Tax=Acer negundo TaxID=4023 RepID=A0AAD5ICP8_ACENE|nr:hypothetical protein LWI28_001661 [Acer negundo]